MRVRSEEIYEGLFDDQAFARLPDLLARAGGGRSAMLMWQHRDGFVENMAYSYFPQGWIDGYRNEFATHDPYLMAALRPENANRVILANDFCSPELFERSFIYNEFVRKQNDDTVHCIGAAIHSAWGNGVIGVHSGRRALPFGREDARRLENVMVHAERVLRVRGELAAAQRKLQFAKGALDAVGLVAMTVRSDGRILQSNPAAEMVLRRADGLLSVKGALTGATQKITNRLQGAVTRATAAIEPSAAAVIVERGSGEVDYLVTITPLISDHSGSTALVLFRDPAAQDNSLSERLRLLFGLTNAEAAVAIDLAEGLTLSDCARNRGVRISTLRAQLKSIAGKTGCSRQSELVALMRRLPPLFAPQMH